MIKAISFGNRVVQCVLKKIFAYVISSSCLYAWYSSESSSGLIFLANMANAIRSPSARAAKVIFTSCWQCFQWNKEEPHLYFYGEGEAEAGAGERISVPED